MPTIPLYNPAAKPDAWHQVMSPGGYEWWYFDAEDLQHDRQIVAILFDGFVFHSGYLRAYERYCRWPTRVPPPVPADYRCAYFVMYEGGRLRTQFMTQYPASQFTASTESPQVSLGPNRIDNGHLELQGTPWKLTWRGPQLQSQQLSAQFDFRPKFSQPPSERIFLSEELSDAEHHWVVANPLCDVEGKIQLNGESIAFRGRGYHDHNYGTAPLGPGLKRWIWGRVLLEDAACTFHFAQPSDPDLPDEVHLIHADANGLREIPAAVVEADWSRTTAWLLRYPQWMIFEAGLRLRNPRLIDSSPFYLRLKYDAVCEGKPGTAFCEIAYPHRLRVPILGRMIEMSIDKR